jgi:hypothetical protein
MRNHFIGACAALLMAFSALGQQPAATKPTPAAAKQSANTAAQTELNDLLQANIRAMWAAFRDKKKQVYADYLWDDYQAVEDDGDGERNKVRALRGVDQSVVTNYTLQLFRVDPISPEAALVTYENVIQFPRGSGVPFEKIFVSEIWVKRHGEWRAWRYQATRVK